MFRSRFHLAALFALLTVGCTEAAPPDPATVRRTYDLRGQIVAADREAGTITLEHEAVEGFMPAMTMPFNVDDDWVFDAAEPGARLRATLVIEGTSSWLQEVVINKASTAGAAAAAVVPTAAPGDLVPPIAMVDQDGRPLGIADYRGGYFLFTFVYTRCPLPDFCPRMSLGFSRLFDAIEADPSRYGDARLLSITVDPAYDTPPVLREYGFKYLEDQAPSGFARWAFATADPADIKALAEFTGLRFQPDSGEIIHSLRTVIVGPTGAVAKAYVGNTWRPEEVLADLEAILAAAERP